MQRASVVQRCTSLQRYVASHREHSVACRHSAALGSEPELKGFHGKHHEQERRTGEGM
jgi:hypothetical protein